jgi:aspartate aminotransferase
MDDTVLRNLVLAPTDPIFGLSAACAADPDPNKINLGVGAYRDDSGKPWVLDVVRKAEQTILAQKLDHEYLPIDGLPGFVKASPKLMLGASNPALANIAAAQTISGTGACRLGADFLARFAKAPVYISNPTWGNHRSIFSDAGFDDIREYPYWDPTRRQLNFDGIMKSFSEAPIGSILLLHPCAHNPTGVDPTIDQWKQIAQICIERKLFCFFDSAYQGFASGNLENDSWAICYFVSLGLEVLFTQSYAKNFGLYNERCGCITYVAKSPAVAEKVSSQFKKLIRASYSNPPAFGARIVDLILNTPALYEEWKQQLALMANRIIAMRQALYNRLIELQTPGTWTHITSQIGMFSFTGLLRILI